MPEACVEHMPGALPEHCREQMHVRNERTYVRTTHLCSYLTFVNAHEVSANA